MEYDQAVAGNAQERAQLVKTGAQYNATFFLWLINGRKYGYIVSDIRNSTSISIIINICMIIIIYY